MTDTPEVARLRADVLFALRQMWRADTVMDEDIADGIERLCRTCLENLGYSIAPTHDGSPSCESGSIASGGTKAHCTCDRCF